MGIAIFVAGMASGLSNPSPLITISMSAKIYLPGRLLTGGAACTNLSGGTSNEFILPAVLTGKDFSSSLVNKFP